MPSERFQPCALLALKLKTWSKFLEELKSQSKPSNVLPGCFFFTQDLQDDSVLSIFFQNHGFWAHGLQKNGHTSSEQGSVQSTRGCPWKMNAGKGQGTIFLALNSSLLEVLSEVSEHPLIWEIVAEMSISQMAVPRFYLPADSLLCSFQFSNGLGFLQSRISVRKFSSWRKK